MILTVLLPSVAEARLQQNSKKESILPNNCMRKVVEELNKSQNFQFADNTLCNVNRTMHGNLVKTNLLACRQSFSKKSYLQIENIDFCLVLQQLSSHICFTKLILSCCFARAVFARRPNGAKQQEIINFTKQMCEESC